MIKFERKSSLFIQKSMIRKLYLYKYFAKIKSVDRFLGKSNKFLSLLSLEFEYFKNPWTLNK